MPGDWVILVVLGLHCKAQVCVEGSSKTHLLLVINKFTSRTGTERKPFLYFTQSKCIVHASQV